MKNRTYSMIHGLFAALVIAMPASMASGAPLFSQTVDNIAGADGSDRDAFSRKGIQSADDLTPESAVTVKSVTWWGVFANKDTPKTPVSFDLIFYADADGVPDASIVISTTTVVFDTLKATGDELRSGKSIYEFRADITPAPLSAGVKVWFSVLADTSEDDDDDFQWAHDSEGGTYAFRGPIATDPWDTFTGRNLFLLDGVPGAEGKAEDTASPDKAVPLAERPYLDWTSTAGSKVKAKFVELSGTDVGLLLENGKSLRVQISQLAPESQTQARDLGGQN